MSSNDVRSCPSCNGLKLLNTGSMTTGYANETTTTSNAPAAAPHVHHHCGDHLISAKTPNSTTNVMTSPTPYDLPTSTSQLPHVWVDNP